MKYFDDTGRLEDLSGTRLKPGDIFSFRCHPGLSCFNRCCRNLNLFLTPYDVLRLRQVLGITADEFLETYVDVVLRPEEHFPEVVLRMADNPEATCIFLGEKGCTVYPDRPGTCRAFPMEHGAVYDAGTGTYRTVHIFRPPDFCRGPGEAEEWTVDRWIDRQGAGEYHRMTLRWAEVRRLFAEDPWGPEGPEGRRARMAFMAAYNLDRFREFVFNSTFLKRYKLKSDIRKRVRTDDRALLTLGFDWIKMFLWGIPSKRIRPK